MNSKYSKFFKFLVRNIVIFSFLKFDFKSKFRNSKNLICHHLVNKLQNLPFLIIFHWQFCVCYFQFPKFDLKCRLNYPKNSKVQILSKKSKIMFFPTFLSHIRIFPIKKRQKSCNNLRHNTGDANSECSDR